MAEESFPNTPHNARAVTEAEYEEIVAPTNGDGLVGTPALTALVFADSTATRVIKVRANRGGLVRGFRWNSGGSERNISLSANGSGSNRIDLIVLRLDRDSNFEVTLEVVEGTPGNPAPAFTQTDSRTGVWEIPLAEVTVTPGATVITAAQCVEKAWYVSDSDGIVCKTTTRPPVKLGLIITETDTGKVLIGVGASFIVLFEDTGNVAVPAATGWALSNGTIRRRSGIVACRFVVQKTGSAVSSGAVLLGTVPAGYRPSVDISVVGFITGGVEQHACRIVITASTGAITLTEYDANIIVGRFVVMSSTAWVAA